MSGTELPIYRLPIPSATSVGSVRIVKDRNGRLYADGSRIESTTATGRHTTLTLANGRSFYVLTSDFKKVSK